MSKLQHDLLRFQFQRRMWFVIAQKFTTRWHFIYCRNILMCSLWRTTSFHGIKRFLCIWTQNELNLWMIHKINEQLKCLRLVLLLFDDWRCGIYIRNALQHYKILPLSVHCSFKQNGNMLFIFSSIRLRCLQFDLKGYSNVDVAREL